MKGRVVHVINNLPVGGAERFLVQLVPEQVRLGWDVEVLTLVDPNPLAADLGSTSMHCMGRRRLNDPRLALDLISAFRRRNPQVVHTHLFYGDTFGRVAARFAGVPAVISTEHSTAAGRLSLKRRFGMTTTKAFAHRLVAVSPAVRSAMSKRLGIPPQRIPVVPNGICLQAFQDAVPTARADLATHDDDFVVVCVGRIVESKGYDALLSAIAAWGEKRLRLWMVGDGPARQALERQSLNLGLNDTVRWLGFRDDVPGLLAAADVFAMPSHWEGHSIALLEAMAAGRACLASQIEEITTTLGPAGAYVQPGNTADIRARLEELFADTARRQVMSEQARRRAGDFTIGKAAESYSRIYEEVLSERGFVAPKNQA